MLEMSEGELQRGIVECAEWHGWMAYHVTNVKETLLTYNTTAPGFQDWNLVHAERALIVYAELKRKGKQPTAKQRAWGQAVALAARHCPERVYSVLWKPEHYDEAIDFLMGRTNTPPGIVKVDLNKREWS